MTLFEQIINEATSNIYGGIGKGELSRNINNAINNHWSAIIRYNTQDKGEHTHARVIFPVAYGRTKADNDVVRAYQGRGDTTTIKPGWKFFRTDRILSWKNIRKSNFDTSQLRAFNDKGDNSMSVVYNIATLGKVKKVKKGKNGKTQVTITAKPITKKQITNNNAYSAEDAIDDILRSKPVNLDIKQEKDYLNKDNQTAKLTAPDTVPVSKEQINTINGTQGQPKSEEDSAIENNNQERMEAGSKPVSKDDINNNPEVSSMKDIMQRMDNLGKEDSETDNQDESNEDNEDNENTEE